MFKLSQIWCLVCGAMVLIGFHLVYHYSHLIASTSSLNVLI